MAGAAILHAFAKANSPRPSSILERDARGRRLNLLATPGDLTVLDEMGLLCKEEALQRLLGNYAEAGAARSEAWQTG
jgi:hypothetical protein